MLQTEETFNRTIVAETKSESVTTQTKTQQIKHENSKENSSNSSKTHLRLTSLKPLITVDKSLRNYQMTLLFLEFNTLNEDISTKILNNVYASQQLKEVEYIGSSLS